MYVGTLRSAAKLFRPVILPMSSWKTASFYCIPCFHEAQQANSCGLVLSGVLEIEVNEFEPGWFGGPTLTARIVSRNRQSCS
jgi:hypothetical protein